VNKRPLAIIAIFFMLGIILAALLADSVRFHYFFIVTLIFISLTLTLPPKAEGETANIFLLLSVASFAALLYINSNTFPSNHISHFLGEEKLKTSMVGIIKSPALTRRPYYGKINSTYLFEIEAVKDKGEWRGIKGLSQIRIQAEKDYGYGDRLLVRGAIRKPGTVAAKLALPDGKVGRASSAATQRKKRSFNYRAYLKRQNIFALINTSEHNITILSHDYKSNPVLKYTYLIREKLKNQFIDKMPLDTGAFLRAILLGDRSELPKDIQNSFKNSGTMHILAISGLHVGLIALVIISFLRFLRIGREFSYIFTILFLIFFVLLTLSRPSVVRAVVMACIFLAGMLLGRKVDVYNSLGAAAIFVLVKNPQDIFNVGFQLSFTAVTFIVFLTPRFMRLVKEGTNFYLKRYLYTPLAVSVSAWLGTFPLILYYFKIITPVSILSNLFIIPALLVLLIGGLCFLLFGWLPFIGPFLANFNTVFCQLIFSLTDFFASLRLGHFNF